MRIPKQEVKEEPYAANEPNPLAAEGQLGEFWRVSQEACGEKQIIRYLDNMEIGQSRKVSFG